MPAGSVANAIGLAPNTLTFHFDRLRDAGLVTVRREGRSMIYAAQYDTMNTLLAYLTENCCQGAQQDCRACDSLQTCPNETRQGSSLRSKPMKRLHVHVAVDDLQRSIGFYSALFAAKPSVTKPDYAKWMLDDPRVNFAISTRGRAPGLDHLGIQVENKTNFTRFTRVCEKPAARSSNKARRRAATPSRKNHGSTTRQEFRGRHFTRPGEATDYGDGSGERAARIAHEKSCCAPQSSTESASCSCSAD